MGDRRDCGIHRRRHSKIFGKGPRPGMRKFLSANLNTAMEVLSENTEDDMKIKQIINLMQQRRKSTVSVSFIILELQLHPNYIP